jgi:glycosyltransferase involved in cell wall biosynthesis
MARCIGEVLDNKELRNKLILAGRKQAAKYSWEKTAKETLMVYEAALKQ